MTRKLSKKSPMQKSRLSKESGDNMDKVLEAKERRFLLSQELLHYIKKNSDHDLAIVEYLLKKGSAP